ncbi:two-component system, OmpR family, alkaline phosphatase synthesis response regulator PhoP [Peptoniphilus asaccharolyticus DSM 20463]|uniref:Two-component system, OmpR family, alkaline phosphatase synthesis response regulator PhoP n=1 Tax=Peptoniphilus asaccharolyticus DSM 20463 TaxID=573058 RepID=A0A1W1VGM7_PEPAS|nr:response regulator transcription factor [Peptoniphilus asaccharolyticus]MBL7575865.1 response regulator transcription factor [Peptoniphilus asaccharolyticus]SMB92231.1 two-component system, OmpR family, alkaline phosphatase synthesis response regulator PhoP [Peptoniphilus asaccharolyticus DSM 20463]
MLIYIVEDDSSIQKLIEYALKSKNYNCKGFENGREFFAELSKVVPDLILLDIMLPDMDGTEILKKLKQNSTTVDIPVMMLTAKTSEYDIVSSLDLGADDYMTKPFSVLELLSRVNALLRRTKSEKKAEDKIEFEGISMDLLRRQVMIDGEAILLTYKEFELLKYMLSNVGIVLSREMLLNSVWGYDYEGETRTVDMHIKLLREKLGEKRELIHTVRGVGYKIKIGDKNG